MKNIAFLLLTFLLVQEVRPQNNGLLWGLGGLVVGNQLGYQRGFTQGYFGGNPWWFNNHNIGGVNPWFNRGINPWVDNGGFYFNNPWFFNNNTRFRSRYVDRGFYDPWIDREYYIPPRASRIYTPPPRRKIYYVDDPNFCERKIRWQEPNRLYYIEPPQKTIVVYKVYRVYKIP